ncbi:MAG: 5'-methylthioadenosine/S-adenosylhomocysteine nucleosidase [Leptolyngbya sp. SIO1E4]|nr:5'-methylthioadenosine/S-adenosylhomocysteine nucleosidase [Leptolyngbya sp. SIO1E4]
MPQAPLKAVIFTALPVEFQEVRQFVAGVQRVKHPLGNVYEQGAFQANGQVWQVSIVQTGVGDSKSALQTERAVTFFDPDVVFFVGVAGGLKTDDVGIGDVVASTKVYGYESGKAEEEFKTRPEFGLSGFGLIEEASAEERSETPAWLTRLNASAGVDPKLKVGPIAVGEKVVASTKSSVCQFLRQHYSDALAVEMEGYGFLAAVNARSRPLPAIVIRGISDLIDNKNDDTHQEPEAVRQQKASHHASALAFQLLASYAPAQGLIEQYRPPRQVNDAVWNHLFSCLQDIPLSLLVALFTDQLSPEQRDILGALGNLTLLRQAFRRLDNLDLAIAWVGHIIRSAEHPPAGIDAFEVPLALTAWYAEYHPTEPPPPPPPSPPGYLLIGLEPKDDQGRVAIMAELHKDGAIDSDLLSPDAEGSVKEPEEALYQHLSQAVSKAEKVKTIEFFLSWQHLCCPIHEWKADGGLGSPTPLRRFRNTVVRSLDRAMLGRADEWFDTLTQQWERLQALDADNISECCHHVELLDCDKLDVDDESKHPILKLLTVLPDDKDDLLNLLTILLNSGIPVWFWAYKTPDVTPLSSAINQLLTADNLKEVATLAETIRKRRKDLPHLGVLFDCPTRRPAFASVSPYRQPAA